MTITTDENDNLVSVPAEPVMPENESFSEYEVTKEQAKSSILSGEDLADIKEQLKKQIMEEFKDENTRKMEHQRLRREAEDEQHRQYVEKMKASPDPWVDIIGWVRTDAGVKVELDWNDAFVDYLRVNGIKGTDDEQTVQKWVTLLLRDMADDMEERFGGDISEYE